MAENFIFLVEEMSLCGRNFMIRIVEIVLVRKGEFSAGIQRFSKGDFIRLFIMDTPHTLFYFHKNNFIKICRTNLIVEPINFVPGSDVLNF